LKHTNLLIVITLCLFTNTVSASEVKLRVLFIGNSLTYSNDLPAIVAGLAKAAKQRRLEYKTVAFPDFSLEDHWTQGDARKEIAKANWDFVVLQQGPSSFPESRVLLREYVRKFADEIKRVGARPAVYMVWPSVVRQSDFDRAIESHKLAASDVNAVLLPAGAAWRAALKTNPELPLYSADNFHPSQLGSYLAAWIIFKRLYSDQTTTMPDQIKVDSKTIAKIELNATEVKALTSAAAEVLKE
jgi:hypothetical protein